LLASVIFVAVIQPVTVSGAFEIMPGIVALAAAHGMAAMHLVIPELLVRVFAVMLLGRAGGKNH
jgi:uncharacterized sodium:solute symporter family permease YidK